jgi:hypothetical protein
LSNPEFEMQRHADKTATGLGFAVILMGWPQTMPAQEADAAVLFDILRLSEVVEIMREEGLETATETGEGFFGGSVPADWTEAIERIYDADRMEQQVQLAMAQATDDLDLGPIVAFFISGPGAGFIELEIAARRAMLDDEVEQMAKEAAAMAMAEKTPLYEQVRRFVEVNDLIETNVAAGMNSSYAFILGLMDGGALEGEVTEEDVLRDIWAQEPELRAATEEWLYSFLVMAYGPAAPDDLETYIAFSASPAGRAANRAVFDAFDDVFDGISFALGRTASQFLSSQPL